MRIGSPEDSDRGPVAHAARNGGGEEPREAAPAHCARASSSRLGPRTRNESSISRSAASRELRQLRRQPFERDPRLEPRERSAQAEVLAEAERQDAPGVAIEVEAVGVREAPLVAVGRAEQHGELVALLDLRAAERRRP